MSIQHTTQNTDSVTQAIERLLQLFPGKFQDVNKDHIQVIFRDSLKSPFAANVRLINGINQALTNKKIALVVWKGYWEGSDEYQRATALYEQLLRVQYDDSKKKYKIRRHDVQTLKEFLTEFGLNYEKAKEVLDKAAGR
jgi:hypothetical protein